MSTAPKDRIPQEIELRRLDLREQFAARMVAQLVGEHDPVLVAGCSWGRDVFELAQRGRRVIAADLVLPGHMQGALRLDLTAGLPFRPGSLGAVVLAEVLEHLLDDLGALRLVREALSDDGVLVVSVPYYNDIPEHHPRIHSPRTLRRLLGAAGFAIQERRVRGGLIRLAWFANLARGLLYRLARLGPTARRETLLETRRRVAHTVNGPLIAYDARRAATPSFWFRRGRYYGVFLSARKGPVSYDPARAQHASYGDRPDED
ncbi:MAG: methyltransferase domain-containing protein [Candidatus Alcyoniella australis]|nr:methyltransferase domain-containing protein [Candidatus Alcyoniella australis]